MAGTEVAITYETIFEILRREKNREELQKLDSRFYSQVFDYIASLKAEIKNFSSSPDSSEHESDAEKLRIQLGNIKRMIADIYNRRERKLVGIAMIKSRTRDSIISTSALLDSERELFNRLCDILLQQRKGSFYDFERSFEKGIDLAGAEETQKKRFIAESRDSLKNEEEKNKEETEEKIEKQPEPEGNEIVSHAMASSDISSSEQSLFHVSKVKITENLPKFVGPNLEIYGPYNPGEVTEVPQMIAKILIDQGKAQAE